MKSSLLTPACLFLTATLLAACGNIATRTPPLSPPPKIPTATSTPTPMPTSPPVTYAPLATATLPADGNTNTTGVYQNTEYGVTLRYPPGWRVEADNTQSQGRLASFLSQDQSVAAILFFTPWGDRGLSAAAKAIRDSSFSQVKGMKIVSDAAITLSDGAEAWQTVITGEYDNGTPMQAGLTTLIGGSRTFSFMAYGRPASYEKYQADLIEIAGSLQYLGQSLYGIPRSQALVLAGGESNNPREYDPATMHSNVQIPVFSGLVSFDPQLNLVPELAESWTVADGVVYTFKLRANARFHNGRPVTAPDVVYSWERAADPATDSDTVLTYLGDIVGIREMHAGEADHISGLKVIDDHTLQVTIDAPKPYFLLKLTYPTGFVLDQDNVESGPDWYRTPNGTGPYRLRRWDEFKLQLYERNEDYYLAPPAIRYVIVQLYSGSSLRLYEAGEIDMTGVGSFNVPRFQDPTEPLHADLRTGFNFCTSYINFDATQPPFDDVKVRQAFSLAFDRQQYIDIVLNGIGAPAKGLYPPGLPGYNIDLESLAYDPDRARQLLAESKYGGPETLPPIVYTSGGLGSDTGSSVAALAQMWQQTLGVTIAVENLEPDKFYDEVLAGRRGQIFDGGWCADYPDPENFADALFHTGAPQNASRYSNPELDVILEQARVETDVAKRMALYQQAEQLIVNDAPVLFTTHRQSYVLVKPYIQGFTLTPIGFPILQYLSIK